MKVAINAVSAKVGGAVTYLQNMLPAFRDRVCESPRGQVVVWRPEAQTADARWPERVEYREHPLASGGLADGGSQLGRLWFDQVTLPRTLRAEGFDVLFSSANFGPLRTSCRHVLLVRNTIYFDPVYRSRISSRSLLARQAAQRWLILKCMASADAVLFPSRFMQDLVAPFAGGMRPNWCVAPFGTKHELLAPAEAPALAAPGARVELLNVSVYSDQKNFGTLLGAVRILHAAQRGRYGLRLTAGFHEDWLAGSPLRPNFPSEREQFRQLESEGVAEDVGWRRYGSLAALYHASQVFVFPSYTESFGHPLLEAMAAGVPVVAADRPFTREMCGDAAVYFSTFDARDCAAAIGRVATDPGLASSLRKRGLARARQFTWEQHVDRLVDAIRSGTRTLRP